MTSPKTYQCGTGSEKQNFELFDAPKNGYKPVEITETGDASVDGGSKTITYYVKSDQYASFQKLCEGKDATTASQTNSTATPKNEEGSSPEETFMLTNTKTAEGFYLLDADRKQISIPGIVRYTDKSQYQKLKKQAVPANWHRVSYGRDTFYFLNNDQYEVWSAHYTDNGKLKNNQKSS